MRKNKLAKKFFALSMSCIPFIKNVFADAPSVSVVDTGILINQILAMTVQFTIIGGAFWAVWGVIVLAGGLKDKNGPALQSGIWQIVGGALIIVASAMFTSTFKFL